MMGGFGTITRDSILDLQGLVKDNAESDNKLFINNTDDEDDFLLYEDEEMDEDIKEIPVEDKPVVSENEESIVEDPMNVMLEDDGEMNEYYDPYAPTDTHQPNKFQNMLTQILPWVKKDQKKLNASFDDTLSKDSLSSSEQRKRHNSFDDSQHSRRLRAVPETVVDPKTNLLSRDITDVEEENVRSIVLEGINPEEKESDARGEKKAVLKGILKTAKRNNESETGKAKDKRRHLFPSSSSHSQISYTKKKNNKRAHFKTSVHVIMVAPYKDLPVHLKRHIWWQRSDYNDFKKTISIISQKLLEHVSNEVWFLSAQDTRFLTPSEKSHENNFGRKWWCRYGHSRRGLEHICTTEEGTFRQKNVNAAISLTLAEQTRQVIHNNYSELKLGMAASRYTSFARDLALAVGRSDEEAVKLDFDSSKMKGYHHYMPVKYNNWFSMNHAPKSENVLDEYTDSSIITKIIKDQEDREENSYGEFDAYSHD